jgi:hypothetical protein
VPTIWHELSHYESRDAVSALYSRAHGGQLKPAKAFAIVAAFAQARQFFENASSADDLVRPLILFYGAVALARGVTLFATPKFGEEALRPAHGVETRRLEWLPNERSGVARGSHPSPSGFEDRIFSGYVH